MPYSQNSDLPVPVTNSLPVRAQDIFRKAFNNAWKEYRNPVDRRANASREEVANRVAWHAVKQTYEKGSNGAWHSKS